MKSDKKLKKERVEKKRESREITKKYQDTKKLRCKAKAELKILLQLSQKENSSKLEAYKDIKYHLKSSQKELTYFGYRGVIFGFVGVILTSIVTTMIIPMIFEMSDGVNKMHSLNEKIIYAVGITLLISFLVFLFVFFSRKVVSPFYDSEKDIRNQIYINEYMINIVDEKIKELSNNTIVPPG
ncbi:hypothetical protein D5F11_016285 [Siminovitchia terrae]|uniref:Uncharacterized protein n=1 Tax=Siminovitchia terrae TaxID=1914933 RepID=A0A429X5D2_SIMTE|nr:hypothetical protein [Siminovitchia terrae]RST58592.1 hypothetical protein D5F11_016285 [Siminovitchia terrae]